VAEAFELINQQLPHLNDFLCLRDDGTAFA
jgi:hypothetical protein